MKTKLIFAVIVTANLSIGLSGASAQETPRAKPALPPLPPGLVQTEDGTIKELPAARTVQKSKESKEAAIVADNPAPGSRIDEAAGAELPEKKPVEAVAPKQNP